MAAEDKIYKCLNPVGIKESVDTFPLAPRLKTLEGKNIHLSLTGEPDVTEALERRLKNDYPTVNWTVKSTSGLRPPPLSDEEIKTCNGLIQGVAW